MAYKKWKKFQNKKNKKGGRKVGKPSRALTQSVYYFKRSFTDTVLLNDPTRGGTLGAWPGAFWAAVDDQGATPAGQTDGTQMRLQMKLSDLPDWTDFSHLFNLFKINGIKIEVIPQYTNVNPTSYNITQAMAYILPYNYSNQRAAVNNLTEHICLQTQAAKKKTIWKEGKSFKHYSKLRVAGPLVADAATSGTWVPNLSKPKWFGFDNASIAVKHYGTQMRFQPINYGTWTGDQQVKLVYTVYFACKGVV